LIFCASFENSFIIEGWFTAGLQKNHWRAAYLRAVISVAFTAFGGRRFFMTPRIRYNLAGRKKSGL
jgi:hypothetical protein